MKSKTAKKLWGNVFPLSPRSHAKIELIWTSKKIRPKKSLMRLLHKALQLNFKVSGYELITHATCHGQPAIFLIIFIAHIFEHTLVDKYCGEITMTSPKLPKRSLIVFSTPFLPENRLCSSRKYPYSPHWRFFVLHHPPPLLPGNSSLFSYIASKTLAF